MPKNLNFPDQAHKPETQGCVLNLFDKFKDGKEIVEECNPYMPALKYRFFVQKYFYLNAI